MQMMKLSAIAFAVAASTTQLAMASAQSESNGFVEDSSLVLLNRALYMNRDFRNGAENTNSVSGKTNGYRMILWVLIITLEMTGIGL
jgi:imipenem/basic amino acid-specific outer membrane pore